jgi:hypothetical protein
MKLLPPEQPVTLYEEGFGTLDPLNRIGLGKMLSDLLERIDDPLVVALDGRWGTGKTHFLKRWVGAHKLENKGKATTIYFDAFAHDFLDDPLVALTGAIGERIPNEKNGNAWKSIKSAAAKLARPLTRIGLAVGSAGATEVVGTLADMAVNAGAKEVEKAIDEFWNRESGRRDAMQQLHASLVELTSKPASGEDKDGVLIFVIDELDRCRPDFALAMLEVIKHFFTVPKVHFVLGVNLEALKESVSMRYGANIDADDYLKKFINISMSLPEQVAQMVDQPVQIAYLKDAAASMGLEPFLTESIAEHLQLVIKVQSISIRDVGKILTHAALIPRKTPLKNIMEGWREMIVSMLLIKILNPRLYRKSKTGQLTLDDVHGFYGITEVNISQEDRERYIHRAFVVSGNWTYVLSDGQPPKDHKEMFGSGFDRFGMRNPAKIPSSVARDFIDVFTSEGVQ